MPETSTDYDVFVSYAKEDIDYVQRLVEALGARGLKIWFDEGELRFGNTILRSIEDALEHSRNFLLVVSPEYLKKPWAMFETGVAISRAGEREGRIVPLYRGLTPQEAQKNFPKLSSEIELRAEEHNLDELAAKISETVKVPAAMAAANGGAAHAASGA